jgi:hypothetical protein
MRVLLSTYDSRGGLSRWRRSGCGCRQWGRRVVPQWADQGRPGLRTCWPGWSAQAAAVVGQPFGDAGPVQELQ